MKLGEVLRLDVNRVPVDPATSYAMVGVLSFGRGLFEREPIENGNTSYRVFYRLKADHVVMSQLFGWEGALALSDKTFEGRFVSPQFPTFLCDRDKLDRRFLGWLMRRPALWEELGSRASGMGDRRRTLTPDSLFHCEIPLPPLPEQRRVVERIDELDAQIQEARTLRHQAADEAEALCRAVLASDPKPTPTSIADFLRLRPPEVLVQPSETYQFAGVYCFGRGVFRGQTKTGMEFAYPRLTRLRTGNLVYPKLMAWEGAFGVVPPECDGCVVSTEFPVFEVNQEKVFPEILDIYFRTPAVWPMVAGDSTGTNVRRRRLSPQDFLAYKFPLPSKQTQIKVRKVKAEVDGLKRLQAETSAELGALLPAILDKAFKGEL